MVYDCLQRIVRHVTVVWHVGPEVVVQPQGRLVGRRVLRHAPLDEAARQRCIVDDLTTAHKLRRHWQPGLDSSSCNHENPEGVISLYSCVVSCVNPPRPVGVPPTSHWMRERVLYSCPVVVLVEGARVGCRIVICIGLVGVLEVVPVHVTLLDGGRVLACIRAARIGNVQGRIVAGVRRVGIKVRVLGSVDADFDIVRVRFEHPTTRRRWIRYLLPAAYVNKQKERTKRFKLPHFWITIIDCLIHLQSPTANVLSCVPVLTVIDIERHPSICIRWIRVIYPHLISLCIARVRCRRSRAIVIIVNLEILRITQALICRNVLV